MLFYFANTKNYTLALNDLTMTAHLFYGSTYFHVPVPKLPGLETRALAQARQCNIGIKTDNFDFWYLKQPVSACSTHGSTSGAGRLITKNNSATLTIRTEFEYHPIPYHHFDVVKAHFASE